MTHVVEIRFAAENFCQLMARLRTWLEDESFSPRTLRYRLSEPESVLRVDFEVEGQAQAFAQRLTELSWLRQTSIAARNDRFGRCARPDLLKCDR
jgi:hypothetical protein